MIKIIHSMFFALIPSLLFFGP